LEDRCSTQQFVILAVQAGSFHKALQALGVNHSRIVRSIHRSKEISAQKYSSERGTNLSVAKAGFVPR